MTYRSAVSAAKAELHVHIEGNLEPEMMFSFAARNELALHIDLYPASINRKILFRKG